MSTNFDFANKLHWTTDVYYLKRRPWPKDADERYQYREQDINALDGMSHPMGEEVFDSDHRYMKYRNPYDEHRFSEEMGIIDELPVPQDIATNIKDFYREGDADKFTFSALRPLGLKYSHTLKLQELLKKPDPQLQVIPGTHFKIDERYMSGYDTREEGFYFYDEQGNDNVIWKNGLWPDVPDPNAEF